MYLLYNLRMVLVHDPAIVVSGPCTIVNRDGGIMKLIHLCELHMNLIRLSDVQYHHKGFL